MPSPLVKPVITSISEAAGQRILRPDRMARVTPDM